MYESDLPFLATENVIKRAPLIVGNFERSYFCIFDLEINKIILKNNEKLNKRHRYNAL